MNRRGMKPSPNLIPRSSRSDEQNKESTKTTAMDDPEKLSSNEGTSRNTSTMASVMGGGSSSGHIPRVRSAPLIHQGRRQRRSHNRQLNLLLSYQKDELENSSSTSSSYSAFSPTKGNGSDHDSSSRLDDAETSMYHDLQSKERRDLSARSASSKRDRRAALEHLMMSRNGSTASATSHTCATSSVGVRSPVLSSSGNSPPVMFGRAGSSPSTSPPGGMMMNPSPRSAPTTPRVSPMLLSRYPSNHSFHSLGGFFLDGEAASTGRLQQQQPKLSSSSSYRSLRSGSAEEGYDVVRAASPLTASETNSNHSARSIPSEIVTVLQAKATTNKDVKPPPSPKQNSPPVTSTCASAITSTNDNNKRARSVSFDKVEIRCYDRTIGDHPSCSSGPSVSIGWTYDATNCPVYEVDDYEIQRPERKKEYELILSRQEREELLKNLGFNRFEIAESVRGIIKVKNNRRQTINNLGAERFEETLERARRKIKKILPFHHQRDSLQQQQQQQHQNVIVNSPTPVQNPASMETGFKHNKGKFLSRHHHREPQRVATPIDTQ